MFLFKAGLLDKLEKQTGPLFEAFSKIVTNSEFVNLAFHPMSWHL
jgi:hypothetical protein